MPEDPVNILLAEDDKVFGRLIQSALEEEGYIVDLVNDGVEAVLRFLEGQFDILLSDIEMPKLDGINALRIIRKLDRSVPAIVFSGNSQQYKIDEVLLAGVDRYFAKPFRLDELKDCIRDRLPLAAKR